MLSKDQERVLRRMDKMGFAGAGEALSEIEQLRAFKAVTVSLEADTIAKDAEIERLRCALETITIVEVGENAASSMRKIALQALRVREAPEE